MTPKQHEAANVITSLRSDSSPKARGKRLKLLRNMAGLKLKDLSLKYKISISSLKFWESGYRTGLTTKGAQKIIAAMRDNGVHCDIDWLMHGVGMQPQIVDVYYGETAPEDAYVVSGGERTHYEVLTTEEIEHFYQHHENAVVAPVLDDGMEPYYMKGDSVGGIRVVDVTAIEAEIGKNCIIETEDQQICCRRFVKNVNADTYNLYCINPLTTVVEPTLYNVKIKSVAPIIRLWKHSQ